MTRSTARRFIRQYSWARSSWRTWAMSSVSSMRSSTIGRSPEIECGHRPDCMPAPRTIASDETRKPASAYRIGAASRWKSAASSASTPIWRNCTWAWVQAQVQLRHIGVEAEEAADFQRLAAPILYADAGFRVSSEAIVRGAGMQSGLWPHSISGDLPIVLLRIDETDDMAQVRQLLRAHEYWRMKRLAVDLVIVNERASSYVQDLQVAIDTAVRSSWRT